MVVKIPKGVYKMTEKRKIVKENFRMYWRSSKKKKGQILDELTVITGYNRKYLITLFKKGKKVLWDKRKRVRYEADLVRNNLSWRGRKRIYPLKLKPYLVKIWKAASSVSSKHLKSFIEENREWIFRNEVFDELTEEEKGKICKMSSSTIERMLREEKKNITSIFKYKPKGAVSSHIKKQVEIESFYERKVEKVGYMEIDLVHHCGNSLKGEFFYTLTAVEVKSGWTSLRLLKNKAAIWTYKALSGIFSSIPYVPYHIHSDNGSEFINAHIISFIKENKMRQTRSRAYRKNDNALVEVKNWIMVRAYTGYRRYNTQREYEILSELLSLVELKHNLFIPTMKIVEKRYEGGRMRKIYETKTPFKRLLESEEVDDEKKEELRKLKDSIDLYELNKKIAKCLRELDNAYNNKGLSVKNFELDISLDGAR